MVLLLLLGACRLFSGASNQQPIIIIIAHKHKQHSTSRCHVPLDHPRDHHHYLHRYVHKEEHEEEEVDEREEGRARLLLVVLPLQNNKPKDRAIIASSTTNLPRMSI